MARVSWLCCWSAIVLALLALCHWRAHLDRGCGRAWQVAHAVTRSSAPSVDLSRGPGIEDTPGPGSLGRREGVGLLEGLVVDRETLRPIAGATLTTDCPRSRPALTDAAGRFSIWCPTLRFLLRIHAPGYAAERYGGFLDLTAPSTTIRVALGPGTDLDGRVVGPTGQAIGGAVVALSPEPPWSDLPSVQMLSDADGRFHFPSAVAQNVGYRLAAAAPPFMPASVFFVAPASALTVTVARPGIRVQAIVTDSAGQPISGATIQVCRGAAFDWEPGQEKQQGAVPAPGARRSGDLPREQKLKQERESILEGLSILSAATDERGAVELFLPRALWVILSVKKEGFLSRDHEFAAEEDGMTVDVSLEREVAEMSVLVHDPDGRPLRNQLMVVSSIAKTEKTELAFSWLAATDSNGQTTVPESYNRVAVTQSPAGISEVTELKNAEGRAVPIRLKEGPEVRVRVTDSADSPLPHMLLGLMQIDLLVPVRSETDAQGWAVFKNVFPSTCLLFGPRGSYIFERIDVSSEGGEKNVHHFRVDQGAPRAWIRGVCLQPNGRPLPFGTVAVHQGCERVEKFSLNPWDDGKFNFWMTLERLEECEEKPLYICVEAPFLTCQRVPCAQERWNGGEVTVHAGIAPILSGTILTASGTPYLGDVGVWHCACESSSPEVDGDAPAGILDSGRTHARGRFCLAGVPAGFPVSIVVPVSGSQWESGKGVGRPLGGRVVLEPGERRDIGVLTVDP